MSSDRSAPPPPPADNPLMPRLYQAAIGPLHTAYYQQQFERFDVLGKPSPSWNWAAGFCTLGWMGLRGLWRPAAVYLAVIAAMALLWWGLGLHQALPLPAALALLLFGLLLAIVIPGFGGNALYHRAVRQRTMQALSQSSTLTQAMQQLQAQAPTSTQLQWATSAQAATVLLVAGVVWAVGNVPAPGSKAASATTAAPTLAKPAGAPHTQADMARALAALQPAAPAALPPASPVPATPSTEPAALAPAAAPAAAVAPASPPPEAEKAQPASKPAKPDTQAAVEKLEKAAEKAKQREKEKADKQAKTDKAERAAKAEAASKAAAAPKTLQPGKYYLNSGIYARAENAQRVVRQLRAAGLPVFTQTLQSQKGEVTRVRVGPLDSRGQAESAAQKAQALHLEAQIFHYAAD